MWSVGVDWKGRSEEGTKIRVRGEEEEGRLERGKDRDDE
jgi:hypothetical protein